ncbi:MAG: hypothetical protein BMS9Abin05_1040 [Rhodothermia bacterium]|nr:MAG: hypothetical protein BMS9Abin05_1040 [Rhodothermia bacterium]
MRTKRYTALIMAGQRPGENDLVRDTGAPHRSFVDIRGEPIMTVQYLLRSLSLKAAFKKASAVLGVSIHAVKMPFAEAAVDVDRVSDLELVLAILEERAASTE